MRLQVTTVYEYDTEDTKEARRILAEVFEHTITHAPRQLSLDDIRGIFASVIDSKETSVVKTTTEGKADDKDGHAPD